MSIQLITVLLLVSFGVGILFGFPLAFVLGGVAMLFTYFLWGPQALYNVAMQTASLQLNLVLIAVPLFIFMGNMLSKSGLAEDLYTMMHYWMGPFRGGLAIGTMMMSTLFAAISGSSAANTATMGVVTLRPMLKRNYQASLALGTIMAGGALGILIPPSVTMIFYGYMAQQSVGKLFLGGVFPGLLLSALFIIYIATRCWFQPKVGPPLPPDERAGWSKKLGTLRSVILPLLLVILVLGSIFSGAASPTEASAVGAFGSLVCAIIYRKLNWQVLKEACYETFKITAMLMWIVVGAASFANLYNGIGGTQLMKEIIGGLGANPWVILVGMQITFFFLGMLLDPIGIIMITVPIFVPVIIQLGFDPLWFGVLFIINMEMAFLTPPFGINLFVMKGIVPEGVTMGNIMNSVWPFVALQATGLISCMLFPQIIVWLPNLMLR